MSTELITGGCACGSLSRQGTDRFPHPLPVSISPEIFRIGPFRAPRGAQGGLVIEGPAKGYSYDNGLGGIRLHVFCSICGSGIHGGNPEEDFVTLIASSLDDSSLFAPTEVINRDEAAPWHKNAASLILHETG